MMNVPFIACTFTEYEKNFTPPYLSKELGVRVTNLDEIEATIKNFNNYRNIFHSRREIFLKTYAKTFQINDFINL